MRILLVEDDRDLADAIVRRLGRGGHAVDLLGDGLDASSVLSYQRYDLVILDLGLPRRDGLELLAELRRRDRATRVLVLTARSEIEDRLRGFAAGADDYLPKPFDFREFDARCDALLRRGPEAAQGVTTIDNFTLDRRTRGATLDGKQLALSRRLFDLLEVLVDTFGSVVTKDEIDRRLNNFDRASGPNAIDTLVSRLRRAIEGAPFVIRTVYGVGYIAELASGTSGRD